MNPEKCRTCQTEIQPATAKRTGGLCMPCTMQADPAFAEKVEDAKISDSDKNPTIWQQVRSLIFVLLVGSAFMAVIFIAKIVVSVIAGLIAKFVFKTGWSTAILIGLGTFVGLGFLGMLLDLDWPGRNRSRRKPPEK